MSEHRAAPPAPILQSDEVSLLALGSVLLRRRWLILGLVVLGGVAGAASALLDRRVYVSSATFIPQGSQTPSGLSLAASQFGISIPTAGSSNWGPSTYIELLRSQQLFQPMARETLFVRPGGGQRVTPMQMFNIQGKNDALKENAAVGILMSMVAATEVKTIGGVRVKVTSPSPEVSLALANRVVSAVNDFNLRTRKSQADAEARFTESQAAEAEAALRQSEDRLEAYLQANRAITSPQLTLQRDRLSRDVQLKQQLFITYQTAHEEARVRQVRETPVVTVFEAPRLPLFPESRHVALKAVLGAIIGATVAILLAFITHLIGRARVETSDDARQFFELLEASKPRFLSRASSRR
jgi:uncharacterized protein involved in exopolysaccharide biosynthesis